MSLLLLRHIPIAARCTCEHQRPVQDHLTSEFPSLLSRARNFCRSFVHHPLSPSRTHTKAAATLSWTMKAAEKEEKPESAPPPPHRVFHQKATVCSAAAAVLPLRPNTLPPAANPPTSLPQPLISTPVHNPTTPPPTPCLPPSCCVCDCSLHTSL